ncbi:MAG: hypothetical protein ACRD0P_18470 [Stackebrandtia sp.]
MDVTTGRPGLATTVGIAHRYSFAGIRPVAGIRTGASGRPTPHASSHDAAPPPDTTVERPSAATAERPRDTTAERPPDTTAELAGGQWT